MSDHPKFFLDITGEHCPMTFVRAKLMIEAMESGAIGEIRLTGAEPLSNVPRAITEYGHEILELSPEPGQDTAGVHRLRIRKR